jgi:transposase-like protein
MASHFSAIQKIQASTLFAKTIHVAMGVNMEGHEVILGLSTAQNEGRQVSAAVAKRGPKPRDGHMLNGFP